jgi:hypothetical protein
MNRFGSVYAITNLHTKEQYVGQTIKSIKTRWHGHCGAAAVNPKFKIGKNIAAYGKDSFDIVELFVAFTKNGLDYAEKEFIAALCPVLNATSGGAGYPRKASAAEKLERFVAAKRRWANPDWRAKTVASIKLAHSTEEAKERGRKLQAYAGIEKRWAGHQKKLHVPCDRSALGKAQWKNQEIRAKRTASIKLATNTEEHKESCRLSSTDREMPISAIVASAKAKWKAVFCPELSVSFLCQKFAAEYLSVPKATISVAIKNEGKVLKKYTLIRVS